MGLKNLTHSSGVQSRALYAPLTLLFMDSSVYLVFVWGFHWESRFFMGVQLSTIPVRRGWRRRLFFRRGWQGLLSRELLCRGGLGGRLVGVRTQPGFKCHNQAKGSNGDIIEFIRSGINKYGYML